MSLLLFSRLFNEFSHEDKLDPKDMLPLLKEYEKQSQTKFPHMSQLEEYIGKVNQPFNYIDAENLFHLLTNNNNSESILEQESILGDLRDKENSPSQETSFQLKKQASDSYKKKLSFAHSPQNSFWEYLQPATTPSPETPLNKLNHNEMNQMSATHSELKRKLEQQEKMFRLQIQEKEDEILMLRKEISELKEKYNLKTNEIEQLKLKHAEQLNKLLQTKDENKKLLLELSKWKQTSQQLQDELKELKLQLEKSRDILSKQKETNSNKELQLESAEKNFTKLISELESQISLLKKENEMIPDLKHQLESLTKANKQQIENIHQLQNELENTLKEKREENSPTHSLNEEMLKPVDNYLFTPPSRPPPFFSLNSVNRLIDEEQLKGTAVETPGRQLSNWFNSYPDPSASNYTQELAVWLQNLKHEVELNLKKSVDEITKLKGEKKQLKFEIQKLNKENQEQKQNLKSLQQKSAFELKELKSQLDKTELRLQEKEINIQALESDLAFHKNKTERPSSPNQLTPAAPSHSLGKYTEIIKKRNNEIAGYKLQIGKLEQQLSQVKTVEYKPETIEQECQTEYKTDVTKDMDASDILRLLSKSSPKKKKLSSPVKKSLGQRLSKIIINRTSGFWPFSDYVSAMTFSIYSLFIFISGCLMGIWFISNLIRLGVIQVPPHGDYLNHYGQRYDSFEEEAESLWQRFFYDFKMLFYYFFY